MNALDFAMEMEKQGQRFFNNMASRSNSPGVRRIFNMVAEDEGKILNQLERFKKGGSPKMNFESMDLEQLKAKFAELTNEKEALAVKNDEEAYRYAMKVERGVCQIYREAAEHEKNEEARKMLLKIGANDCREALDLQRLSDFVNAPNQFLAWGEFSNLGEFHNFGRDQD